LKHLLKRYYSCYYNNFLLLLCLFFLNTARAQEPASYILGEDQFKGVKIYDVIQDKSQHFWISTDEGLYEYDYQKYRRVDTKNAKTNALFQFIKSNDGTIYCTNLSNQVFQIKNGECSLFYEIPESQNGSSVKIAISPNNNLIVASDFISIITPDKKKIVNRIKPGSKVTSIACFKDKSIHFTTTGKQILQFKNYSWKNKQLTNEGDVNFIELNGKQYLFDITRNYLYEYSPKTGAGKRIFIKVDNPEQFRYYTAVNHLWFSGPSQGVYCYSNKTKTLTRYFKDYFISDVFEDKEGNVLLSTFDRGIIIVPDLNVPGVLPSFNQGEILALYDDKDLGLVCGTDQGIIYTHRNKSFQYLLSSSETKAPIEGIYGNDQFPFLIVGKGTVVALNKRNRSISNLTLGSLKDVIFAEENTFYTATNKGLYLIEWQGGNTFKTKPVAELNYRTYALAYDKQNEALYVSTAKGLMYLQAGKLKPLTYQNQELYVSDFYQKDGIVWASTQNFGILKFSGTQVVGVIQPKVDGNLEYINKFVMEENYILASTSSGFYKFTTSGSVIDALHISNSFGSRRVYDFIANDNHVWVSHFGGVQQLNLNYRLKIPKSSYLQISKVWANDKLVTNQHNFSYEEKRISFVLTSPTLRNKHVAFSYKLEGFDDFWIPADNQTNTISYSALPPGDYKFVVKQEDARGASRTIIYPIHISSPFYMRWWFLLLIFCSAILLVYYLAGKIRGKEKLKLKSENTVLFLQLELLKELQKLNSKVVLPLSAVSEKWISKTKAEQIIRENFDSQIDNETTLEVDWKLDEESAVPLWVVIPFVYHALSFGFNGKMGQKLIRLSFSGNEEIILFTIEDNIPRFANNKTGRLEADKQLAENVLFKKYFATISAKNSAVKVSHNEKISGEQMLGTTVAVSIPKLSD
jgi:hypothetical protein